jgi:hypothetical protein
MRTNFSIVVGVVLILGFSACKATAQTNTNHPVPLTPEMFTGYQFTLISDTDYYVYSFPYEGMASEDFGQKKGGALVGIGEGWRIDNSNTLVFTALVDITPADPALRKGFTFTNPGTHSLQFQSFSNDIAVTTYGQKLKRSSIGQPN